MRVIIVVASAVVAALAASPTAAWACEPAVATCLPRFVVFPAYTPEGGFIGHVETPVRHPVRLEASRFTGQPLTVVYNDPGRHPGTVEPGLELQPLPRVARFKTQGVYPRGY